MCIVSFKWYLQKGRVADNSRELNVFTFRMGKFILPLLEHCGFAFSLGETVKVGSREKRGKNQ